MVEESDLKQWKDAGHVARRTLEGIKGEIVAGKGWNDVIDSAERFIRRHGGQAAFPVTISVNDMAALILPIPNLVLQRDGKGKWCLRRVIWSS